MLLSVPPRRGRSRCAKRAFTLIEVLVVVAIIALLISILLPSLNRAREMARRSACLSNLHQNGVGLVAYSTDFRGLLPMRGHYGYDIKESNPFQEDGPPVRVNYGILYGKYVGKSTDIFSCPGYFAAIQKNSNWEAHGIHTFFDDSVSQTFGGYMYAAPVGQTLYASLNHQDPYWPKGIPKDGGIWHENYHYWLNTTKGFNSDPGSPKYYLNYKPPLIQAIQVDQIIGLDNGEMVKTLHKDGLNALFSDMHAKFVNDDSKKTLTRGTPSSGQNGAAQLYGMWEYFGRHH